MIFNSLGLADYVVWLIAISLISWQLSLKYAFTVGIAFGYIAINAMLVYANSLNGIPVDRILLDYDLCAYAALVSFLLTVGAVSCLKSENWRAIFRAFAFLNAGWLFLGVLLPYFTFRGIPFGALLNGSMSGCLQACIFPLFAPRMKWQRFMIILSVLAAGRSLPLLTLGAVISAELCLKGLYLMPALLAPVIYFAGVFVKGSSYQLFNSQGRTTIWSASFDYWMFHVQPWLGTGLGGFFLIGPTIYPGFTWLHSDWMQIIFETGLIGGALVVAMYLQALYRARFRSDIFCALVGYAVYAACNMPLRYPIAGLFGAVCLRSAFEKPKAS